MNPKIYLVGGAVRDKILGKPINDRDYVVVGATPEWMIANGYERIEATNFPVYLHKITRQEFALARQERKTGKGYHGFETTYDPTITLEDDLLRRDLTINSMAMDDDGNVIDPYGGLKDIENKVLRHTSEAFADDPLRVLRVARFAARYSDFTVAPETIEMMKKVVASGELKTLPRERIWMELSKGLDSDNPAIMRNVLAECGAAQVEPLSMYFDAFSLTEDVVPEDEIFKQEKNLEHLEKFLLTFPTVSCLNQDQARYLRIPGDYHQAALDCATLDEAMCNSETLDAEDLLALIKKARLERMMYHFEMNCIFHVLLLEEKYGSSKTNLKENFDRLRQAVDAIQSLDMRAITAGVQKSVIKHVVEEAKLFAIRKALAENIDTKLKSALGEK